MRILITILSLFLLSGCVSTIYETRTVNPDGTYTVNSQEITQPYASITPFVDLGAAVALAPWVGINTPWAFYNDSWFYNGSMYGFYGVYGWRPYGSYPSRYLGRPGHFYNNPHWNNWYRNNPQYRGGRNPQNNPGMQQRQGNPTVRNAPSKKAPTNKPTPQK